MWTTSGSKLKFFHIIIRTISFEHVWIQKPFPHFEEKIPFQRLFLESAFVINIYAYD